MRPSFWLRLTAVLGAAGTLVAVISGSASLGAGHRVLAALALPPLAAVVAAAWVEHRRLLYPSLAALVLFGLAAAVTAPGLHLALAALAFTAAVVSAAATFRGEAVAPGSIRDYVTLTKPRIMSLLLLTGLCGMVVGAEGLPRGLARRGDDGRPRARMRRGERAQPRAGRGHRQADGQAHALAPGGRGAGAGAVRARVRARAVGALVRAPRRRREHADRGARARREPLLRPRLHALPEAIDAAEHRHRRRGRSGPAARRLGGRDREPDVARARPVRRRLPLDAAALLGARAADQARLRGRRRADAAGRARRARDRAADRPLHVRARRVHARTGSLGQFGLVYLVSAAALGASFLWLAWRLKRERTPRRAALLFHYSLAYLALLFVAMAVDSVLA